MTNEEIKALLPTLPRTEKEMLLRLPHDEAMLILELHHQFPGSYLVEEGPVPTAEFLPTKARARNSDPSTSHAAAATLDQETLRVSQEAVLSIFRTYEQYRELPHGMTGDEFAEIYPLARERDPKAYPEQSPSGLRTRRRELVDMGFLVDTGQRRLLESGRWAIVWGIR